MKVLLINGSAHKQGNTFLALSEAAKTLEQQGIETEIVQMAPNPSEAVSPVHSVKLQSPRRKNCAASRPRTPSNTLPPWPIALWLLPASLRVGALF